MAKKRSARAKVGSKPTPPPQAQSSDARARGLLVLLLLVAVLYYSWNAYTLPPLIGYDSKGHALYISAIVDEGRLPDPLEGWSTFHPPLYYLVASSIWPLISEREEPVLMLGLRAISMLGVLLAAGVGFVLARRLGTGLAVAGVATGLALWVPVAHLAATMVGNEAFGAGLAALAMPALLRLQMNPRDVKAALFAGGFAGLALATKYTGLFVAVACVVPFLRSDFDRGMLRALVAGGLVGAVLSGPVYVRNWLLTGSPIPMTRTLEPMKSEEDKFIIRERQFVDYLWFNPQIFVRPSLYHEKGRAPHRLNRNPAMSNVWGLTYAGMWYDPFGARIPAGFHQDGVYWGTTTTLLGIVPTLILIFGFGHALRQFWQRRSDMPEAPLVVMSLVGLLSLIAFSIRSHSAAAVKASYLLPMLAPAVVFYARGIAHLPTRGRIPAVALSAVACIAAAYIFTHGLLFELLKKQP